MSTTTLPTHPKPPTPKTFPLQNFTLQNKTTLPSAHLTYLTLGSPSSPAIIYPTWYSGTIATNLWLTGEGKTLDPAKFYIIIPALFGNGESTSPSNWIHKDDPDKTFPEVTFYDNVRAQHLLLTEGLGVKKARAVVGWSMGAAQSFQWATQFPGFVELCVPFCGSARTSLHNRVFLEGVKAALLGARGRGSGGVGVCGGGGGNWEEGERGVGLRALGRVYSGWGFSQAYYREKLYETVLGFKDLEDFMVNFWEAWALSKDPENMLTMLHTWQTGDVSQQEPYNGDFSAAMKGIKAKTLVLPCKTDLYFPPEDSEIEVENMRPGIGEMKVFPSIWGHWAGGPGDSKEDVKWLDDNLREFFANN